MLARFSSDACQAVAPVTASKMGTAKQPVKKKAERNCAQCMPGGSSENASPGVQALMSSIGTGARNKGTRTVSSSLA